MLVDGMLVVVGGMTRGFLMLTGVVFLAFGG